MQIKYYQIIVKYGINIMSEIHNRKTPSFSYGGVSKKSIYEIRSR